MAVGGRGGEIKQLIWGVRLSALGVERTFPVGACHRVKLGNISIVEVVDRVNDAVDPICSSCRILHAAFRACQLRCSI